MLEAEEVYDERNATVCASKVGLPKDDDAGENGEVKGKAHCRTFELERPSTKS